GADGGYRMMTQPFDWFDVAETDGTLIVTQKRFWGAVVFMAFILICAIGAYFFVPFASSYMVAVLFPFGAIALWGLRIAIHPTKFIFDKEAGLLYRDKRSLCKL